MAGVAFALLSAANRIQGCVEFASNPELWYNIPSFIGVMNMSSGQRIPKLPELLERKIYKSGQTRGADDDEIYQNRVGRTGTVLIPYYFWNEELREIIADSFFEKGYIVLIKPEDYFSWENPAEHLAGQSLCLGENCLVFYETRSQWNLHNPDRLGWIAASSRTNPLLGNYIARIPATTATADGGKINRGFTATRMKGAGIRQYEYAPTNTVKRCRIQLEAEYWLCYNSIEAACAFGMTREEAEMRRDYSLSIADNEYLLDFDMLRNARIIDDNRNTVCPLCLEPLSAFGFYSRLSQAEGREVPDLTVTEINLFHINELRYGVYNHKPYNLGWGHHHCNVVVKDAGIMPTLSWMKRVIQRNEDHGTIIQFENTGESE